MLEYRRDDMCYIRLISFNNAPAPPKVSYHTRTLSTRICSSRRRSILSLVLIVIRPINAYPFSRSHPRSSFVPVEVLATRGRLGPQRASRPPTLFDVFRVVNGYPFFLKRAGGSSSIAISCPPGKWPTCLLLTRWSLPV